MLNLSDKNQISEPIDVYNFKSFGKVMNTDFGKVLAYWLLTLLFLAILVMFLPWTQNIRAMGIVTSLKPEQRPQQIVSTIAGRIEKWFAQEGDFVRKGDTILFISEIKDDYFDPKLLDRTQEQISSKEMSAKSYMEKANQLDKQIDALNTALKLKLEQANNKVRQQMLKVQADSADFQALIVAYDIAQKQYQRQKELYKQGLKSLTELEQRENKLQEAQAKYISQENKLLATRNELINSRIELNSIDREYSEKLAKARSDKYSALSDLFDAEATVSKLQNQYSNYSVRLGLYYITAPQDGFITRAVKTGIGENIKEGEEIISIMPANYELAVEMYIRPVDLPLIRNGQKVRFQFDGWPAIIFSGWPNTSYGTFGGKVVAIDNFISEGGKYRILVAPDKNDYQWPKALRVGSAADGIALLGDVPLWYEIWRQLNGFPPDYYWKEVKPNNSKDD